MSTTMVQDMLEAILQTDFGSVADLSKSMGEYNSTIDSMVTGLHTGVVKPVAAVVISIMFVLELARNSTRIEADRELGVKIVAATMFKCALLLIAAQHADLILKAMNEVGDTLIRGFMSKAPETIKANHEGVEHLMKLAKDADEGGAFTGMPEWIGCLMLLGIPWLFAKIGALALKLIIFYRFAELYIFTAFATLPIAFLGHPSTASIAVGYLRKYAAAVLHGAVIVLVVVVYTAFLAGGTDIGDASGYDSLASWAQDNWVDLMWRPCLFGFLLFSSSKLSRALVGE